MIYGHGFQTQDEKRRARELRMLALYLRDECGMKPKEIQEYVTQFCEAHCPNYHFRAYYRMIGAAVRHAENKKNVLIQIDSLPVYQSEVEYIDGLDLPYDEKKLMFSILMLKKLDKECYEQRQEGEYKMGYLSAEGSKLRFLKKTGDLGNVDIPKDIFFHWREKGLIRVSYAGFILDFMDQMEHDGVVVLEVEHFDCFGLYWDLLFNGAKIAMCQKCNKPFRKATKTQTFCKDHKGSRPQTPLHKTRVMQCLDCGQEFYVSSHAVKAKVCPVCARKGAKVPETLDL